MANLEASTELLQKYPDINPFILYKWERMFKTIFDANASNEVNWDDYYLIIRRVRQIYGNDSEQMTFAKSAMKALWQGLFDKADQNKDEQVSVIEWIELLKKNDPSKHDTWYGAYCVSMFKLFDDAKGKPMQSFDLTQFRKLWDDYFYATDKKLVGNHLFGILEC
uniref:EF-hand domain-containing protein n=1 Tax=Romanomermis culicivorax TaxID=13658 RepID=A0A915JG71_ROMCU